MVTHQEFVRMLREEIQSLELYFLPVNKFICRGFKPDIAVLVGATSDDKVIIDAINDPRSLNHDIAGLLKIMTNLDKEGVRYRKVIGVCSERIKDKDISNCKALIEQYRKFVLIRPWEYKTLLQQLMLESAREKIEKVNNELLTRCFGVDFNR